MSMRSIFARKVFAARFAGAVLCSVLCTAGRAQLVTLQPMTSDEYVQVSLNTTGEATISAWSRNGAAIPGLDGLLPRVVHCQRDVKPEGTQGHAIRCMGALRRDGLALEAVVDLAPIARELNGSTGMEVFLNYPRLGFESSSVGATDEEEDGGPHVMRTARFAAGVTPEPITIRFGYRHDQLAGIYGPLVALALVLTLIAAMMARAGYAPLASTAVLLGMMVWMGVAALLEADGPVRILLFGDPLADFAVLFMNLWPPLFCVALGVELGSRMRGGQMQGRTFGAVFSAYAILPLMLTCVVGSLPHFSDGNWFAVVGWLAAAPVFLLARRAWNRVRARSSIRLLTAGELKERIAAMAARAGCPQAKIYISFSANSRAANAFALPGRAIFLTALLIRLLSKREVDAVAAHELSHVRHSNRGRYTALCIAMLLCETPAREVIYQLPGGLAVAMIVPIAIFLVSLRGLRRREFLADAGATALTGDPRAMISSLARIARNNDTPLAMNAAVEWFSSHPATTKRIGVLAAGAGLPAAEVEALCASDDAGEHYEIPGEEVSRDILFTPAWQKTNAGVYGWLVIFGSCGAGLLAGWLIKAAGPGILPVLGGVILGCALAKCASATAMARNYGRLGRKLAAKFGAGGKIVGFAPESEPRVYNGYRFPDAGLLRFENGRLCYQSERTEIALNAADVVEVGMAAAAPSNWFRRQPMVRFRSPDSGQTQGFILHTLGWLPAQRRLLRSIERWKAAGSSTEGTAIKGLDPVAGEVFRGPTIAQAARGFLVVGGVALAAAIAMCAILRSDWQYAALALGVAACAYASMLLPSMLYRPPSLPPELPTPVETN